MNTSIQSTIILLIEQIVVALGGEFKLYLPQLIPHMLRVFMHDNSQGRVVSIKVGSGTIQGGHGWGPVLGGTRVWGHPALAVPGTWSPSTCSFFPEYSQSSLDYLCSVSFTGLVLVKFHLRLASLSGARVKAE